LAFGLVGLIAVGTTIWVATRRGGDQPAVADPVVPTASASVEPPATATTVSSADVPVVRKTATLRLSSDPAGAKLFFDDEELRTNPARKEIPVDDKVHQVRAEAPGYAPATVDVKSSGPEDIVITLRRLSGRTVSAPPPRRDPPPEAKTATPPPEPPPPATTATEPKNARDRIKDLDTSNPWGK